MLLLPPYANGLSSRAPDDAEPTDQSGYTCNTTVYHEQVRCFVVTGGSLLKFVNLWPLMEGEVIWDHDTANMCCIMVLYHISMFNFNF